MEIDRITINYKRHTQIEAEVNPDFEADGPQITDWNVTEKLILDRQTQTLEITRQKAKDCDLSIKYHSDDVILFILDELDADDIFIDKPTDRVEIEDNPRASLEYRITVNFDDGSNRVVSGKFNYNELPTDYSYFVDLVRDCMDYYGYLGELFSPALYEKPKTKNYLAKTFGSEQDVKQRLIGKYIFCSVEFGGCSSPYYYLADKDIYNVGDTVIVPVGNKQKETKAEIVDIEYFDEEFVPIPLDKVKKIIRKVKA